jgi:hypothetical protein
MSQERSATEKATRRRALIFCAVALVALFATLKLLGVFGHFQRVEATVVDSADSSLVAGATVVAIYTRSCVGSDDKSERTVVLSRETISNEDGVFVLEEANLFSPPGPKTFSMGLCQFSDEPDVYIVKPGYLAAKLSDGFTANIPLTSISSDDDLEGLRLAVSELKTLVADTLLAKASPAFYARLERDLEQVHFRYQTLHKAHVDSLQEQLKELSAPLRGKAQ